MSDQTWMFHRLPLSTAWDCYNRICILRSVQSFGAFRSDRSFIRGDHDVASRGCALPAFSACPDGCTAD